MPRWPTALDLFAKMANRAGYLGEDGQPHRVSTPRCSNGGEHFAKMANRAGDLGEDGQPRRLVGGQGMQLESQERSQK